MQKSNKKTKIIYKFSLTLAILGLLVLVFPNVNAEQQSIADGLSESDDDTQEKIEELEKRAKIYREIIAIKQKQQESLNNQLDLMGNEMHRVETEIELNKRRIDSLNDKIANLQRQVVEKEEAIKSQTLLLTQLLQTYYAYSQQNSLSIFLTNADVASFMAKKDHLAQTGDKIKELVDALGNLKQQMLGQISDLEKSKAEVTELSFELQDKSSYLENSQQQKMQLLEQTQGEQERYQQLLARVEQQKLELLNIDELYNTSGLSVDSFAKPSNSAQASLSWFYSQRDPKWGDVTIGNSKSTLKSYGCAIAAVSMVFTKLGTTVTPMSLAKQPIFSWDLIFWPRTWPQKITMAGSGSSHGNIDWSVIDAQVKKGNPVIVYLKRTAGGGHYVVVHSKDSNGKYVVHDPYFGPNLYLDTSKALVGAMGGQSSIVMDQMIIYNK